MVIPIEVRDGNPFVMALRTIQTRAALGGSLGVRMWNEVCTPHGRWELHHYLVVGSDGPGIIVWSPCMSKKMVVPCWFRQSVHRFRQATRGRRTRKQLGFGTPRQQTTRYPASLAGPAPPE
jgi:hypothetical protein